MTDSVYESRAANFVGTRFKFGGTAALAVNPVKRSLRLKLVVSDLYSERSKSSNVAPDYAPPFVCAAHVTAQETGSNGRTMFVHFNFKTI